VKLAAQLVRRGATMLAQPCQKCGGIQVRFKGKTYCTGHDDLSTILATEQLDYDSVVTNMRALLLSKLDESAKALENETDHGKQDQLVSLMTKYFELLQKSSQK
jgi:UPF0148 protein